MRNKSRSACVLALAVVAAVTGGLSTPSLHAAATDTWTGVSGADWSAAGNWSLAKPGSADTALFNSTLGTVANAVADQNVASISFDTAAGTASGSFAIGATSGNKLILTNAGTTQILVTLAGTGKTITINAPITLTPASGTTAGTYTFSNNSADVTNTLNFAGAIAAGTTTLTETLTLTGTNTGSNTLSGVISNGLATNGLAISKAGAGTWILSGGSNTYSGGTTITVGTLQLNNASNGGLSTSGTLTLGGGTLQSLLAAQSVSNVISLTGSTIVSGSNSISFTGDLTQTASKTITSSIAGGTLTLAKINLDAVTGTGLTLLVTGTGTTNLAGVIQDFSGGIGTAHGSLTINNTSTVTLSGANTYGGLTLLSGAGTYIMTGTNISGGATTTSAGILQLNNASNGGLASGTLNLSGGTMQSLLASQGLSNVVSLTGTSTVSGANSITFNGDMSETASAQLNSSITGGSLLTVSKVNIDAVTGTALTLTVGGTGNTNFSGVIQDFSGGVGTAHGNLTITNTGTTTLGGGNTYGGTTSITSAGGTVNITGTQGNTAVNLNGAGAILSLQNVGAISQNLVTVTQGTLNETVANALNGTAALTVSGGTANLSLSNNYSGATLLTSGIVNLGNKGAFGNSAVTLNSPTITATTDLSGVNAIINSIGTTQSGGVTTFSGTNNLEFSGTNTSNVSHTFTNNISGGTLTLSGTQNLSTSVTNLTLTINGSGNTNISGILSNGTGGATGTGLTFTGGGILTLSNANTYGGTTTVGSATVAAGTLLLSGAGKISNGPAAVLSGTLDLNNNTQTITTLTLGGGPLGSSSTLAIGGTGTLSLGGGVTYSATNNPNGGTISGGTLNLVAPRTFTVGDSTNATNDLTVSATIGDGNGIFDVTKAGTGTMVYTPAITLSSPQTSTVSAGTLTLSGAITGLNGIFSVIKAGAGTLQYNQPIVLAADQTLTVGVGTTTLAGAITGSSGITIAGAAKFTAADLYGGATTVNSGSLTLSGAAGAVPNSVVTVNSGASLIFDSSTAGVTGTTRAASVTLHGSSLAVNGNSGANSIDTITNALTIDGIGSSSPIVTLTPNSQNTRLSLGSLVRANNGVVLLRGTSLGTSTLASQTGNQSNIMLGIAPTGANFVGGNGAAGSQNINIIPWAIGGTTITDGGSSFVTYDANGIRPLAAGEYDTAIVGGTSNDHNVNLALPATTTITADGNTTVNSLYLSTSGTGTGTLAGTGKLTITSGAVYANFPTTANIVVSKQLDFGTVQGVIGSTNIGSGAQISEVDFNGGISGSGGVVFYNTPAVAGGDFGTFVGTSTYTGDTTILGNLQIAVGSLPSGTRTGDIYVYGRLELSVSAGTIIINGLNGTGNVDHGHSNANFLNVGDNNANGNFSGTITASGGTSLIKIGTGTQVLSGVSSTFFNPTSVQNGILSVVTLNNVTTPSAGSSLGKPNSVFNGTIALGNLTTTGQLTVVGTGETTDRVINLAGASGGGTIDQSGTGQLKFTSAFTATGAGSKTLTLQGSTTGTGEIGGAIVDNSVANKTSVAKNGTGTWLLSGSSTYTGGTTINAGTLIITNASSLGAATGSATINNGTLEVTTGFASARAVTLGTGSPTIQVDAGTYALSTALAGSGSLTKTGVGTLAISALPTNGLTVSLGTLQQIAGGSSHTLTTLANANLTVTAGTLDLTNNDLLLIGGSGQELTLATHLASPVAGPSGSQVTTGVLTGAEFATFNGGLFHGSTPAAGDLVLLYTYAGDANLDGKISMNDYLAIDDGYLFGTTGWVSGDFNHDGVVNATDYALIDTNFAAQSGPLADGMIALHTSEFGAAYTDALTALAATAVPEPASLALLGLGAISLLKRRR